MPVHKTVNAKETWSRPRPSKPVNGSKPNPDGIDFMLLDATYRNKPNMLPEYSKLPYKEVPVVELFGVTAEGRSVCAHVHGFLPRYYVDSSALMTLPKEKHGAMCDRIMNRMETLMRQNNSTSKGGYRSNRRPTMAYSVMPSDTNADPDYASRPHQGLRQYVHSVSTKRATSIYGHHESASDFVEITMRNPQDVPASRGLISRSKKFSSLRNGGMRTTYEANVEFIIRFMIDTGITGCGWVSFDRSKYRLRRIVPEREGIENTNPAVRESSCDLEFDIHWKDLIGRSLDDPEWQHVAPLVEVSMDAEMRSSVKGQFPNYREPGDMIISIANQVKLLGEDSPRELNVFMVGTSDSLKKPKLRKGDPALPDPVVYSFDTEADMLRAWYEYINKIDADIITGYNIYGFDMEYVGERVNLDKVSVSTDYWNKNNHRSRHQRYKKRKRLKCQTRFHRLGRLVTEQSKLRAYKFQNNAYGKKTYRLPCDPGRFYLDSLEAIRRDVTCKYRSYRLDAVSEIILGLRKVDVDYKEITPLFEGTDADRARLGEYNLMDVVLPSMLLEDKAYVFRFIEEARVCNVPSQWLLTKGQQVKVMAQLLRETRKELLLIPNNKRFDMDMNKRQNKFTGAIVIDPVSGYYTDAVVVLDFNSLYPSIMRRWNLCYTTWIPPGDLRKKLKQGTYKVAPNGHAFLTKDAKEGLLPRILRNLLEARSRAKKDMAVAAKKYGKNSTEYKKQNGRQNALKVSANSVYGFTGAMVGRLPCIPIASAVTGYGRWLIEETKRVVEALDPKKYEVIYGDTDSVMVRLRGVTNIAEALDIGQVMEDALGLRFKLPIKIEREKVFLPYCLITKKRYAGLHWERADAPYYINSKGLISVRRDNALFASNLFGSCLNTLYGYNDAFASSIKFAESEYPTAERGEITVIQGSDTSKVVEIRHEEEGVKRDHGVVYAKIDPATGEVLRPGWVVSVDPHGNEKKMRVGEEEDAIYTFVYGSHESTGVRVEKTQDDAIAERTRGLVYAKIDMGTGEVLRPGWVKKRNPQDPVYTEWLEMVGDSVQTAVNMVQETRQALYSGDLPLDLLTISKAFSREPSEYAVKQPHVELALRMAKRDAGSAPKVGDRVPFVVVKKHKGAKLCEKAEDPKYVEAHGIPMDYTYYDERQLMKPLTQLFAPVLAKRDGVVYVAPEDDDEMEDDEMEDYTEDKIIPMDTNWNDKDSDRNRIHQHTVFDTMKAAAQKIMAGKTESEKRAARILFPAVSTRKMGLRGATVLYNPEDTDDSEEMEEDIVNPFEFFSRIDLPKDPAKEKKKYWRTRDKKVYNAFDLLRNQAKRDFESK